jgi:hypothetical protein
MPSAETVQTPKAEDLRNALIARAKKYSKESGVTLSDIGTAVANDSALISDLESGRNITFKLYDKLREYLDANEGRANGRSSSKRRRQ